MAAPSFEDFFGLGVVIRSGDKEAICEYIESKNITKQGFNNLEPYCNSPISYAVTSGHLHIIKYFIEEGLDFQNRDEDSILHLASKNGQLAVVKTLVEDYGFDVASVNKRGDTPLRQAVVRGFLDIVKYFVESGADVNDRDTSGSTLLSDSVGYRHLDIFEYILSRGFRKINAEDAQGNTALLLATLFGNKEFTHKLLDYRADVHVVNIANMSLFWAAASNGDVDILQRLDSLGADPEVKYKTTTSIVRAAEKGHTNVVHYLAVNMNLSLNKETYRHYSPLHAALMYRHWSTAVMLLRAGANITGEDYRLLSESLNKCSDSNDATSFFDVLCKPRSLRDVCCFTIRRILRRNINSRIDCLPLPCKLVSYLKLAHVQCEELNDECL